MRAPSNIHRPRRHHDPRASRDRDHAAEARIARNTLVSNSPSVSGAMRSTVPNSVTSIDGAADRPGTWTI